MARLQILELPEGSGDDRPPFVLVVDQWDIDSLNTHAMLSAYWDEFGKKIGARGVLCVERAIELPANDTSAYIQQAAQETGATIGEAIRSASAQHLADERTDIARDMDRLAKWRDELADALGMERGSSWDVICHAARVLRRMCDDQAEAIERVRNLHRPVEHGGITICAECSGWDDSSTDNSPCSYEHCPTLKALATTGPAADA